MDIPSIPQDGIGQVGGHAVAFGYGARRQPPTHI
jgi:hypothetical protein